ncbi:hypothetical protein NCS57_00046500 [Fusarium keratoplasticum]|uniref:Uncharacterized protein n=1 Tax=Fusarium keratoplasticum TaxID=1328300 RepID=A0ACC0RDE2_9HYPO|nr:hypothetical protein NCS57_00046500 [Fusarium keratoplasticum]KAI8683817.1 hypothetical protein NCS57_00046500 [Fusarium keratoplasticum]
MVKIGPPRDANSGEQPSTLYSLIMTPINITVFLLSLFLVDLRYTQGRINRYGDGDNGGGRSSRWMPRWFTQPYQHIGHTDHDAHGSWHYHSKQKKLMKMEADEAFQMRSTVLVLLAVMVALGTSAAWYLTSRLYHGVVSLAAASADNTTMPQPGLST